MIIYILTPYILLFVTDDVVRNILSQAAIFYLNCIKILVYAERLLLVILKF